MKLRYIEVFLTLAQTPNMRDVAHKLFVSQAAISSTLRDLEDEIGIELFDRVGRGIRLNEKGRILQKRLEPLYHQLNNVLALLSTEELMGKLFIGASLTLANWVLPQILYNMKKQYPQVELDCHTDNTFEIIRKVENSQLDLGFVEGDVSTIDLAITYIGSEDLVIVTSDKKLASKPQKIEDLMQHLWLLREVGSGTRENFLKNITPLGLRPAQHLELTHTDAIKHVLQNSGTLSCLSPCTIELEVKLGMLFVVPIKNMCFKRSFYCIERKENPSTPLRKILIEALQSRLTY